MTGQIRETDINLSNYGAEAITATAAGQSVYLCAKLYQAVVCVALKGVVLVPGTAYTLSVSTTTKITLTSATASAVTSGAVLTVGGV